VGIGNNCKSFKSLCFAPLAKVREQLLQKRLDLQKLLRLPYVLRVRIAVADLVHLWFVDRPNVHESIQTFNDVRVNRIDRQTYYATIFGDVDATLSLEKARYPSQVYSFHDHYDRALARIVAITIAVTRAKITLDQGALSWINDYVKVVAS
jgi:hypothetical protein